MSLPIISADERLAQPRCAKIVLVGVPGVGKTTQLKTLPEDSTLFVDLEAGDLAKSCSLCRSVVFHGAL
jgi:signal recognition particle receptor subunit beta